MFKLLLIKALDSYYKFTIFNTKNINSKININFFTTHEKRIKNLNSEIKELKF